MTAGQRPPPPDREESNRGELSYADKERLAGLNKKLQILRDRTTGVARGYTTGTIVTGRGGTGKSFTVLQELDRLDATYRLTNSHLTPKGLFNLFADHPDAVHVIEDAEEVTRNRTSLGVLRSALWGSREDRDGRSERLITWETNQGSLGTIFGGGVIMIANRSLSNLPEVQALATRVPCVEVHVSDQEIAALMRHVATKGFQRGEQQLSPTECLEVADFIVRESARLDRSLDMRILVNAFADRLQYEDYDSGCTWQDLVYSTLCGRPAVMGDVEPAGIRAVNKSRELKIAREIVELEPKKRLEEWKQQTNASQATMYRRLAELARMDALD